MDLKSLCFHLVFASTLFFLPAVLAIATGSIHAHNDQEALLAFKAKVTDPLGFLRSWNSSIPFCQWYGVTCGHRHRTRVIKLELSEKSLAGSLSPYIGNLSFLRVLDLSNNSFSQKIPSQLGYLTRLRYLLLQVNSFEGEIPANISACSRLFWFSVRNNKISGILPMELGSLSMLQVLRFDSNNLVGEIPVSYGNLTSLQLFLLYDNTLSGTIPNTLGKLAKLHTLGFYLNRFSGIAPFSLFNISSLTTLHLSSNQLLGTLPQDLDTTLPKLEFLSIRDNHFSGSLPVSLSNMSSLGYFEIGRNKFSGEIPNFCKLRNLSLLDLSKNQFNSGRVNDLHFISSLTNATELRDLNLEDNGFVGRFSDSSFKNLSMKLEVLFLSGNKIYGNLPVWISSYVNLTSLDLSRNLFSGAIPQEIGKLHRLQCLIINQNNISGFIPSSVSNLSVLTCLYLFENSLVDKIPSSLGKCQSLLYLDLHGNNLTGSIPSEVFLVSSLVNLNISGNQLSGKLPEEVGNLKNLVALYISRNRFVGEIPSTLGSCATLKILFMEGNLFQGIIPSTFKALKSLEQLDLSNNNLSGEIPKFLKDFNLGLLNMSHNNFEGAVPEGGIFQNLSVVSVSNNPKLCGGLPAQELPKCNNVNNRHLSKFVSSTTFKLVISLVSGLLGLVILLAFLLLLRAKRSSSISSTNTIPNQLLMISYQGLFKATNGFCESNLIGVGSYGSVYKGTLDNHSLVAIKVLNMSQHGASKSFMAECDVLRNIRHRNLVKLLTACSGVDYHNDDFKALIYEFMVNGNLDEWLHQNPDKNNNITRRLSFSQLLNIAIDVAHALDYLHNGCETSIVHCDLKPSNILLDNGLVAHVGDFGLATSLPSETKSSIKGSIGYTAPEYGMGSKPSTHGDVYSFGILLLEMFTGKRPTNDTFTDLMDLHCHVRNALPGEVIKIVDPRIIEDWDPNDKRAITQENVRFSREAHKQVEGLIAIFRLGVACSSYSITERENMKGVVQKLCSIRDVYTANP